MFKSIFLKARFISAGAIALLFLANIIFSATPIDPSATPQAKALLNYIYSIYGKQMLTGQMHVGWGDDDVAYVNTTTGKYPAIMGIDFINEDQTHRLLESGRYHHRHVPRGGSHGRRWV
jgi:hypothetical protein